MKKPFYLLVTLVFSTLFLVLACSDEQNVITDSPEDNEQSVVDSPPEIDLTPEERARYKEELKLSADALKIAFGPANPLLISTLGTVAQAVKSTETPVEESMRFIVGEYVENTFTEEQKVTLQEAIEKESEKGGLTFEKLNPIFKEVSGSDLTEIIENFLEDEANVARLQQNLSSLTGNKSTNQNRDGDCDLLGSFNLCTASTIEILPECIYEPQIPFVDIDYGATINTAPNCFWNIALGIGNLINADINAYGNAADNTFGTFKVDSNFDANIGARTNGLLTSLAELTFAGAITATHGGSFNGTVESGILFDLITQNLTVNGSSTGWVTFNASVFIIPFIVFDFGINGARTAGGKIVMCLDPEGLLELKEGVCLGAILDYTLTAATDTGQFKLETFIYTCDPDDANCQIEGKPRLETYETEFELPLNGLLNLIRN